MQITNVFLGLLATKIVSALPGSLAARIPLGIEYTVVSPDEIPEFIKNSAVTADVEVMKRDLQKRANYGVYLCTDANWGGHCVHIIAPENTCVPLAADLNDKVSSVGPDAGAYCRFFFNAGCTDDGGWEHFDATSPGYANLNEKAVPNPNDKITSYMCWRQ